MKHGIDCPIAPHTGTEYLHAESDHGPFDDDGVEYCGRCHMAMDIPVQPRRMSWETYNFISGMFNEQKAKLERDYTSAICYFVGKSVESAKEAESRYVEHLRILRAIRTEFEDAIKDSYKDHPNPEMRRFWGFDIPEEIVDKI
jgi:hypothetical protein